MANLDYEQQSTYNIVVRSTDSGTPPKFVEKTFTVKVLDVNEMPTSVSISNNTVSHRARERASVSHFWVSSSAWQDQLHSLLFTESVPFSKTRRVDWNDILKVQQSRMQQKLTIMGKNFTSFPTLDDLLVTTTQQSWVGPVDMCHSSHEFQPVILWIELGGNQIGFCWILNTVT